MLSISYFLEVPLNYLIFFQKSEHCKLLIDLLTRKVICPCEAGEARSKSPGYNWCQHDILMHCIIFYQKSELCLPVLDVLTSNILGEARSKTPGTMGSNVTLLGSIIMRQ